MTICNDRCGNSRYAVLFVRFKRLNSVYVDNSIDSSISVEPYIKEGMHIYYHAETAPVLIYTYKLTPNYF